MLSENFSILAVWKTSKPISVNSVQVNQWKFILALMVKRFVWTLIPYVIAA